MIDTFMSTTSMEEIASGLLSVPALNKAIKMHLVSKNDTNASDLY
jgi:hypothetical protein